MESQERISCRVTQLYNVKPEDFTFPWYMFSLDISTTFINYSDRQIFLVDRRKFLDETTSRINLADLLLEMNVPVLEDGTDVFIIDRILESAKTMANCECLQSRKILRLRVEIDVKLILDDDDDDDEDDDVANVMPASKAVIEALEETRFDEEMKNDECVICLEEFVKGGRAIRLPCSHVYHGTCIRVWLKCNGVCPLCRFKVSS